MRLPALICLAALAALCQPSSAASAKGKKMTETYRIYRSTEGSFACELPKSWDQKSDERLDRSEKVYGVFMVGPRSKDGVATKISLDYYSPGNRVFPAAEDFLKANLEESPVKVGGEKTSPMEKLKVSGLAARRFVRSAFEYLPPNSMNTKEIPITEEVVVLERGKGFFVLHYSAADSLFKKHRPKFQRVLDTFRPL